MQYIVENYLEMIRSNLSKKTNELVEKIGSLVEMSFAEEVNAIFIESSIGEPTLYFRLSTREDMFDEVFEEEVDEGFAGSIDLLDEFLVDEWLEEEWSDTLEEFYEKEGVEESCIAEIGRWVYQCFNQANGKEIGIPSYFEIHDAGNALDLLTGEWVDPEDVEL